MACLWGLGPNRRAGPETKEDRMSSKPKAASAAEIAEAVEAEIGVHGDPHKEAMGCCRSWLHVLSGATLRVLEVEYRNDGHPKPNAKARSVWNDGDYKSVHQERVSAILWRCAWYLHTERGVNLV